MEEQSFFFIGDLLKSENGFPINLFSDLHLNRASSTQQSIIKRFIEGYTKILNFNINKYECVFTKVNEGHIEITQITNSEEWNYLVVEYSPHADIRRLQIIFSLCSLNLTMLFQAIYMGPNTTSGESVPGIQNFQLRTLNYFHDSQYNHMPEVKFLNRESLEELKYINAILSKFEELKFPFIAKALNDFVSIKDISERSSFKVINCFSVLESLLTSNKSKLSNNSSLSNQLKKKINLLNNQFKDKIEFSQYFTGPDTITLEIIIEKLYQYRSDIAHGNLSDFEKDLHIFKTQQEKIYPFLLILLQKCLIFSLENPQLIKDLKEC